MRARALMGVVWLAACLRLGYDQFVAAGTPVVPPRKPLAEFPRELPEGWVARDVPLAPEIIRRAAVSHHLNRVYQRSDGASIYLYLGYYDGRSIDSIHHPEVCFPGEGFEIASDGRPVIGDPRPNPLHVRWIEFKKGLQRRVTAYAFYVNGRYEPDPSSVYQARMRGVRHYAILTLSISVRDASRLAESKATLEAFVRTVSGPFEEWMP